MTQAPEREQTETTAASPQARVDSWLAGFQAALDARDGAAAGALFATDSYWRDLVAFTWNLKTVEGPQGVADVVDATAESTDASSFHTTEPPDEADKGPADHRRGLRPDRRLARQIQRSLSLF